MIKLHNEELLVKPVSKEILKEAANKLMFDMSDQEYETLLEEFDILTKQFELMNEVPGLDGAEPMVFPFEVTNDYLREDSPTEPLSKEEALKNASDVKDGQIILPKVVR